MTRPDILRLFRIAVSVVCGILCVMLIALWVRSYSWADELTLASRLRLTSIYGYIQYVGPSATYWFEEDWDYLCWRPARHEIQVIKQTEATPNGLDPKKKAWLKRFGFRRPSLVRQGSVPYWVAVCIAAALSVAPWVRQFRWRFSLRTLLLAMTLVAVVLGLVVAMR